jgi:hypothetical protein
MLTKLTILTLLIAGTAIAQVAETNFYPLINIGGKTYTNATVAKLTPATAMVTWDSSGEQVAIANLPMELQRRYGYDPVAAQRFLNSNAISSLFYVNLDGDGAPAVAVSNVAFAHASSQTKFITFTNKTGEVITNAAVLSWNTVDLFYEVPGGGARVHFTDLPPDIQKRFGYDPVKGQSDAQREAIRKKYIADDIADRRAIDAERLTAQREQSQLMEAVSATKVGIYGRIIQKMEDGTMLVDSGSVFLDGGKWHENDGTPGVWGTCLLVGYSQGVDGETVHVVAYPDGEWTYTTVTGAARTVRRFQYNPNAVSHVASQDDIQHMTNR